MNDENISFESRTEIERINHNTLSEKIGQILSGLSVPVLGGLAGYWATEGPGGAGIGMVLTSLGMSFEPDTPSLTFTFYKVGFIVGSTMALVRGIYLLANQ